MGNNRRIHSTRSTVEHLTREQEVIRRWTEKKKRQPCCDKDLPVTSSVSECWQKAMGYNTNLLDDKPSHCDFKVIGKKSLQIKMKSKIFKSFHPYPIFTFRPHFNWQVTWMAGKNELCFSCYKFIKEPAAAPLNLGSALKSQAYMREE